LSTWRLHPEFKASGRLGWAGIYTGYMTVHSISTEDLTITISECAWDPRRDGMSRESAERFILEGITLELKDRLDEIEALMAERGLSRTPELRKEEHFKWAVRFQILEERVTDIAASGRGRRQRADGRFRDQQHSFLGRPNTS
jgi:hypothetical protein